MEVKVSIQISNRHIHLNNETYYKLFDNDLTVKRELNQVGQFAAKETVQLKTFRGTLDNVTIVGPLREYNQVEISHNDARMLGLNPPVRKSGDILVSEVITVETPKNYVEIDGCIIADRHVHMNPEKAEELGVVNGEVLKLKIDGQKSGIIDVYAKISDDGFFEVHLDTDDANAFLLEGGEEATLII